MTMMTREEYKDLDKDERMEVCSATVFDTVRQTPGKTKMEAVGVCGSNNIASCCFLCVKHCRHTDDQGRRRYR